MILTDFMKLKKVDNINYNYVKKTQKVNIIPCFKCQYKYEVNN